MLFFGFSISFHIRYRDNVLFNKLCKDKFNKDYRICFGAHRGKNMSDEDLQVVPIIETSNNYLFAVMGLKIGIECFLCCFLGSWSDRCGRKFPLLIALIGENFDSFIFFFMDFPFMYFILSLYILSALSGLFGGYICVCTMAYCSVTDNSTCENRTLAFAVLDSAYVLGVISGVVAFKEFMRLDHVFVSFLSLLGVRCALFLWTWLTFTDKEFDSKSEKFTKKITMLLSCNHLIDIYVATSRQRLHCGKEQLTLIACSAVPVMVYYSCKYTTYYAIFLQILNNN